MSIDLNAIEEIIVSALREYYGTSGIAGGDRISVERERDSISLSLKDEERIQFRIEITEYTEEEDSSNSVL